MIGNHILQSAATVLGRVSPVVTRPLGITALGETVGRFADAVERMTTRVSADGALASIDFSRVLERLDATVGPVVGRVVAVANRQGLVDAFYRGRVAGLEQDELVTALKHTGSTNYARALLGRLAQYIPLSVRMSVPIRHYVIAALTSLENLIVGYDIIVPLLPLMSDGGYLEEGQRQAIAFALPEFMGCNMQVDLVALQFMLDVFEPLASSSRAPDAAVRRLGLHDAKTAIGEARRRITEEPSRNATLTHLDHRIMAFTTTVNEVVV